MNLEESRTNPEKHKPFWVNQKKYNQVQWKEQMIIQQHHLNVLWKQPSFQERLQEEQLVKQAL